MERGFRCTIKNSRPEYRPRYGTVLPQRLVYFGGNIQYMLIHIMLAYYPHADTIVGTHDAPIRCVEYCPEVNVMVTGSWDRSVRLWDPRTPCNAGTFTQPEKVAHSQKHSYYYVFRVSQVSFLTCEYLSIRCTRSLWLETG